MGARPKLTSQLASSSGPKPILKENPRNDPRSQRGGANYYSKDYSEQRFDYEPNGMKRSGFDSQGAIGDPIHMNTDFREKSSDFGDDDLKLSSAHGIDHLPRGKKVKASDTREVGSVASVKTRDSWNTLTDVSKLSKFSVTRVEERFSRESENESCKCDPTLVLTLIQCSTAPVIVACGESRDSSLSKSLKLDNEIAACILSYIKYNNS